MATKRKLEFEEVCSKDFLKFKFGGRGYQDQLNDSIAKTGELAAVKVECLSIPLENGAVQEIVWVSHNFGFLGGSLGCAEGEKITRAFELAKERKLPICVQCRSGGARMQEGTSSLMQMAKVSVAVQALQDSGLPFISVLSDPTFGGVSASYAMQADVRIAIADSISTTQPAGKKKALNEPRIGFAGPTVILNTMCEGNTVLYDEKCPNDFQSASFVKDCGQIDMVLDCTGLNGLNKKGDSQKEVEKEVAKIACLLTSKGRKEFLGVLGNGEREGGLTGEKRGKGDGFNYMKSRLMDRPQTQDILFQLLDSFVELSGDGKVGRDICLRGGIGYFQGTPCVMMGTFKGHTPTEMQNSNYGMPSPHGYRTALRLMKLAEHFHLPIISLIDTVGAWPAFECEVQGQSEAIATNLTVMAGLKVPMVSILVGEGGSGGALGICMGNAIGMLSGGYFGVISPEGAASILGRYRDEKHKAEQFPKDCQSLAQVQGIYAPQLKDLGVVDQIIWEVEGKNGSGDEVSIGENYKSFPVLKERIAGFISESLKTLSKLSPEELIKQRYEKYRKLGNFDILLDPAEREKVVDEAKKNSTKYGTNKKSDSTPIKPTSKAPCTLLQHLAELIVSGERSKYRKLAPSELMKTFNLKNEEPLELIPKSFKMVEEVDNGTPYRNAKAALDAKGPDYMCKEWIQLQRKVNGKKRVLLTDTTMRDAHQSLLATRVRTIDVVNGAKLASKLLDSAFSLEVWGGATFDVCMRFLDECPWERLRQIRQICPNICLQMLIRGSNAVGYTSYPDNVVEEFISLASKNGIDVFRIFDCFNNLEQMKVSINAVLKTQKSVAEVCICYTGKVLTSEIYNLKYYQDLAVEIKKAGAHILAIKDMAGLLKPNEAAPLLKALRSVVGEELPIHFHTHATSSGSLATCWEMAVNGCEIIDCAVASMADGTSQPSLNTFVAMLQGGENDTGINFMDLEPYDVFWAEIRKKYSPFESGMKCGTARVFDHQIPGGQYSNLLVQCESLGLTGDRWAEVLDAYRDVNLLFGDIVKVTPSSKVVGDVALYLVLRNLTTKDLINPVTGEITASALKLDFPESAVGLMQGKLGYPHLGFPEAVKKMILKSNEKIPVEEKRIGLTLPPADFVKNIEELSTFWNQKITPEEGMSSILYPKVFSDFMTRKKEKGLFLPFLPTEIYWYAMCAGDNFEILLPKQDIEKFYMNVPESVKLDKNEFILFNIECVRISSLLHGYRNITFRLSAPKVDFSEENQTIVVRDTGGEFVFDGPMADPNLPLKHVGSPMSGTVEKILVQDGQTVSQGDILCTISAMKMEVKVSAPCDGVVGSLVVPNSPGYRVVEGALLIKLK